MGRSSGGFSGGSRGGGFGGSRGSGMRSSGGGGRSFSSGSFSGGRSSSTFNHSRPTSNSFGNYNSSPFSSGGSPRPVRPIIWINSGKSNSSPYGTYNTGSSGSYNTQRQNNEPYHKNYKGYTGGPRINIGCLYSFLLIVIIITLMAVVFGGLWSAMYGEQNPNSQSDITYSTTKREPLPSDAVTVKNGYYTDDLGWITSKSKVESGMKSFYEDTGVMPYLYLTDKVDGEIAPKKNDFMNFADAKYDELFTASNGQIDEAHILVIFHEYYDGEYTVYWLAGKQAQSVIDDEAGEILMDYFDRYYYDSSKDNSEYFAAVFKEAGEAIMKVTRPAWYYPTIIGGIILIILAIIAIIAIRNKNKKEQDKRDQEILNTPLETFGDNETTVKAEDLAKKYETVYKDNDN